MRLFGIVDGKVDWADLAGWLYPPFDLTFGSELKVRRRMFPVNIGIGT